MTHNHDDEDHDHAHDHGGHGHHHGGPGHSHAPKDFGAAFAIGTALNLGYVVVQVFFSFLACSLALLADAGHNLGDAPGLLLAWWASHLVKTRPTQRRTCGLGRPSILAALANAVFCWWPSAGSPGRPSAASAIPNPSDGRELLARWFPPLDGC